MANDQDTVACNICMAADVIFILVFLGLNVGTWVVRPRAMTSAHIRKFLYALMASISLSAISSLVCLIHCAITMGKKTPATSQYIPPVFTEFFCMSACTILFGCILYVLGNRFAAVFPGSNMHKAMKMGHIGMVAVLGLLTLVDTGFAAKYASCMIMMSGKKHTNDMMAEARHHWAAAMVASHAVHLFVALYAIIMSAIMYRAAKRSNVLTMNILSLGLTNFYLVIRCINMLFNCAIPMLSKKHETLPGDGMLLQMLIDGIPLVLAYVSMMLIGKRHEELGGVNEAANPFRGGPRYGSHVEEGHNAHVEKAPVLSHAAGMGTV